MELRRLTPEDAEPYLEHRQRALATEPLAFLSSPEDDVAVTVDAMRRRLGSTPDSVVIAAIEEGDIVGSLGVYREPKTKAAHKAHIWGMFVDREHRSGGVGRALLLAALDHAGSLPGVRQVHLGVTDAAVAARRLYESLGFRRWGTEPRYLRHDGRYVDSHHLVLALDEPGPQDVL